MQDARNFKYSSDYPMPVFVYKTAGDVSAPALSQHIIRVAHNLPFTPLMVGQWSTASDFITTHDVSSSGGVESTYIQVCADDTYVYIWLFNGENANVTRYYRLWAYAPTDYIGDVVPITDNAEFRFSTDDDYLELYEAGEKRVPDPYNFYNVVADHSLGYIPQCRVWTPYTISYDGQIVSVIGPNSSYISNDNRYWCVATENKLLIMGDSINATDGANTGDYKIFYHIYTNEA